MTFDNEEGFTRPFSDWLRDLSGGLTHDMLGDELRELVLAVQETGRPGKLTLDIIVKPASTDRATVIVGDKIKVTKPEGERGTTIFFITDDGNLTRHNPMQMSFALRDVSSPPPGVDGSTGEIAGSADA